MNSPSDKLHTLFGGPGWSRFVTALREARDSGRAFPASVTVSAPTDAERRRHAALLRRTRPSQASRLRYDLAEISQALAASGLPCEWSEIIETLCGPIPPSSLARLDQDREWAQLWPSLRAEFSPEHFPGQLVWLEKIRRDGVLRKVRDLSSVAATALIRDAARLLCALPVAPEQPLARLAARYFGDSHALDIDRPLASIVLRGLALRVERAAPTCASERRDLWESAGVICDELSAPVLTFNLGLTGDDALARIITAAFSARQPLHLTTRLLWSADWSKITPPACVFICENPAIVALAADALGPRCAPIVCVDGEPKTAAWRLLRSLRDLGTQLRYHGDFDWGGVAIASRVMRETGATPWRFDAHAYRSAARYAGRPLLGTPALTPWSPLLGQHMQTTGLAYDQETLIDDLMPDLETR